MPHLVCCTMCQICVDERVEMFNIIVVCGVEH